MTDKNKSGGKPASAPAGAGKPAPANAPAGAAAATGTATEPRKRNLLSPQKQLAIAIAGLTAILNRPDVAKLLTEPERAQVKAASAQAEELNAKTIKPVTERIKAIQAEFTELLPKITQAGTAEKVKDLSTELGRLQKRLTTLTSAAH